MRCRFPGCRGGTGDNWTRYCDDHSDAVMERLMYVPSAWADRDIEQPDVESVDEGVEVVFHTDPDDGRPHAGRVESVDGEELVVTVTATRKGEFPDGLGTERVPVDRVVTVNS